MLSRPSSRIRRLIPHRRTLSGIESGAQSDSDECPDNGERDGRKDSWYMARRKKQSSKPIRASSISVHEISGPLPPLPNKTPRSSDSSLCSCGHNGDLASKPSAPRRPCLCGGSSKEDKSEESLQIPNATTYEEGRPSSQHSPRSRYSNSPNLVRNSEESITSNLSLDRKEASSPIAEDRARESSEQLKIQPSSEDYSDNIQQLIQEADEAFKADDTTLADVRLERYSPNEDTPRAVIFDEPPMSNPFTERPGPSTPDISPILQSPLRPKPHHLDTSAIPAPIHSTSASKRKKSKNSKSPKGMKPRKPVVNKPAVRHVPRWTLTENVSELFSGRLFNKVEVDEMLTQDQIEEFKRRRMSDLKTQQASEASKLSDTESVDTPLEPFHLDDLPSRIGSAGVKLTAETPVEEKVNPTFFYDDVDPEDFSVERDRDELFFAESSTRWNAAAEPRPAAAQSHNSAVPRKSLRGLMTARKQPPGLPSIPEATSSITSPIDELFIGKYPGSMLDSVADSDYVYLRSSPCTLTATTFRHGPIRVAKADLFPEPSLGADEGLDWTAFQMAILGGAGDWNSESDDTIRRRTVEEIDELVDWWESWDFDGGDGLGNLLTEDPETAAAQSPPSPTSTLSGGEYYSSDTSHYSDIKQDNPYSAHHRWQTLRRQAAVQGLGLPGPKTSFSSSSSAYHDDYNNYYNDEYDESKYLSRHSSKIYIPGPPLSSVYTTAARPLPLELSGTNDSASQPRKFVDRESLASLPQSPMLDLRVIGGGPDGDDVDADVVPMGYNLGHDLGDFLKWEAEHVYAAGGAGAYFATASP